MQLTVLTLLAAAAMVQASCIPLLTCGMKRDVRHPHARDVHSGATPASPESIDFGNAFHQCLFPNETQITPAGNSSFLIQAKPDKDGAPSPEFHDCTSVISAYRGTGELYGPLVANPNNSYTYYPTPEYLESWKTLAGM